MWILVRHYTLGMWITVILLYNASPGMLPGLKEPEMTKSHDDTSSLLKARNEWVAAGVASAHSIFAVRAQGCHLWDADGKDYLDFAAGIGVVNVGHNHPRVVAAVRDQLDRFVHTAFQVVMYEPYVGLAERLCRLIGGNR